MEALDATVAETIMIRSSRPPTVSEDYLCVRSSLDRISHSTNNRNWNQYIDGFRGFNRDPPLQSLALEQQDRLMIPS